MKCLVCKKPTTWATSVGNPYCLICNECFNKLFKKIEPRGANLNDALLTLIGLGQLIEEHSKKKKEN